MSQIILFNKPFGVLSQFTAADGHTGLAEHIHQKGFYPTGRLDHDSEGLLLLTDDGQLQARISNPKHKLPKVYWAQVEGEITTDAIQQLEKGVELNDGLTLPAKAKAIPEPQLWQRQPPVRERKSIPTSWLQLTIVEGRNRQVRRMTAAVGFPTLRLIRQQTGTWSLDNLQPGELRTETVHLPRSNKTKRQPRGR